jgi:hypothetical protein
MILRFAALAMSILVATLSLGDLFTIATRGISITFPQPSDIHWSIDPLGKEILFTTSFTIHNHGAYHITHINTDVQLLNQYNHTLISYHTHDLASIRGSDATFDILIPLNLDNLSLFDWVSIMYTNASLRLAIHADAQYMFELLHFYVRDAVPVPWTSPLASILNTTVAKTDITALHGIGSLLETGRLPNLTTIVSMINLPQANYSTASGWGFSLVIQNITDTLKQYIFTVTTPIPFYSGRFVLTAVLLFGLDQNLPVLSLQHMGVAYAED